MNQPIDDAARPAVVPGLHPGFAPAVLWNRAFRQAAVPAAGAVPLVIGLERTDGSLSRFETAVFPRPHALFEPGLRYAERLVKSLLWMWGGYKIIVGGPPEVAEFLQKAYARRGRRRFDANLMATAYDRKFVVEAAAADSVPPANEKTRPLGRHLDGCRIGFDLGASDRKVSAVLEGETVFSEEIPWDPRNQSDPGLSLPPGHVRAASGSAPAAARRRHRRELRRHLHRQPGHGGFALPGHPEAAVQESYQANLPADAESLESAPRGRQRRRGDGARRLHVA